MSYLQEAVRVLDLLFMNVVLYNVV